MAVEKKGGRLYTDWKGCKRKNGGKLSRMVVQGEYLDGLETDR